jgi:hypothetical protein
MDREMNREHFGDSRSKIPFWERVNVDGSTLAIIAIALGAFAFEMALCNIIHSVYGEDYKFNMTKELEDEERVLQICIETTIKLEFCDSRYGALDKPYGEAVK